MTKYREILRLKSLGFSERNIALSCACSRNTVSNVIKKAAELRISWPFNDNQTDADLREMLFPKTQSENLKRKPDYAYIRKELLRNGVSKKLLWTEYMEECRLNDEEPLMYSQFCFHIQHDEQKRRATMHVPRKPGEQVEVDWAGDPAQIIDPDTGEITKTYIFVGVMSYSQYAYVEAFINEKQKAWITAHVHMYEYFGGVSKILVPDNCKTAVVRSKGWYSQQLNTVYHEMAQHYNTAIIPARVRKPKDKPNAEGVVGNISTWITAALRNEQFFSLSELNIAIKEKLQVFNSKLFQKKEGSRLSLFQDEEIPLLIQLPTTPYEIAEWKQATVQFNYHISLDGMLYSIPYEYIGKKVDVRITDKIIEVFYNHNRIASHRRHYGRKGYYSTINEHMPQDHQKYLEWNSDRFRKWAQTIGANTFNAIDSILKSRQIEQQAYRSCMGILKLADKYSQNRLESACEKALTFTSSPSYKSIKNILLAGRDKPQVPKKSDKPKTNKYGITRGSGYYGGKNI
jgi:transposase